MIQDISYFEQGYINERYFVRVAEAECLMEVTSSQSAISTRIKQSAAALTVRTTVVTNPVDVNRITLTAFTSASIAVQVKRIRSTNVAVSSAYSITASAARTRMYSAAQLATATIIANDRRVRYNQAAVQAASSFNAGGFEITVGGTRTTFTIVGDING